MSKPNVSVYRTIKKITVNSKDIEYPYYIILDRDTDTAMELSYMHHLVSSVNELYTAFEKGYKTFGYEKVK